MTKVLRYKTLIVFSTNFWVIALLEVNNIWVVGNGKSKIAKVFSTFCQLVNCKTFVLWKFVVYGSYIVSRGVAGDHHAGI